MKKLIKLLPLVFLIACSTSEKENIVSDMQEQQNLNFIAKNTTIDGIAIPDGSVIERIDESSINIHFPDEVYVIEEDQNQKSLMLAGTKKYSCNCKWGSGACAVINVSGKFGCLQNTCTGTCEGSFSSGPVILQRLVDLRTGISFIHNSDTKNLKDLDLDLLTFPAIKSELDKFIATVYPETVPDFANLSQGHINRNYRSIGVNIFGYIASIYVPKTSRKFQELAGDVSCSCNGNTGSCKKKSDGPITSCIPNKLCSPGCTMTVSN